MEKEAIIFLKLPKIECVMSDRMQEMQLIQMNFRMEELIQNSAFG